MEVGLKEEILHSHNVLFSRALRSDLPQNSRTLLQSIMEKKIKREREKERKKEREKGKKEREN